METVRPSAVAGTFYPADPGSLRASVEGHLRAATPRSVPAPRILIAPHAGYLYSGPIAGSAYRALAPWAEQYERVVLIGPAHRVWFAGVAVPSARAFRTPLGDVPICGDTVRKLVAAGAVIVDDEPHRLEHSLEVHLPFLISVLGTFRIVPLVVGEAAVDAVADGLRHLIEDPRTLLVVSTDLSHYLPRRVAAVRDLATATAIEDLNGDAIGPADACGCLPLRAALALAREEGLEIERLDLRDSSDTAGSPDRVVGYGAWTLGRP